MFLLLYLFWFISVFTPSGGEKYSTKERQPSKDLFVGTIGEYDGLLLEEPVIEDSAIIGRTFLFEGPGVNISFIMAVQIGGEQDATVEIINGGLRQPNVTLSFISPRGGLNYNVVIWGRKPHGPK